MSNGEAPAPSQPGQDVTATEAGAGDQGITTNVPTDDQVAAETAQNELLGALFDKIGNSIAGQTGPSPSNETINLLYQFYDVYYLYSDPKPSPFEIGIQVSADLRTLGFTDPGSFLTPKANATDAGLAVSQAYPDVTTLQSVGPVGEPIEVFSGQFVLDNSDVVIHGAGIDFVFRRTYKNKISYDGPLGINWDHSYNLWIGEITDTMLRCSNGALGEYVYTRHPKFGQANFNYWVPPDGVHEVIVVNATSFARIAADGTRYIYEPHASVAKYHRLARIQDRTGDYLAFGYTGNLLTSVEVNHPSRLVKLSYNGQDRIASITDHTGRVWTYTYDDLDDLVAFTQPATDRYPAGLTTHYEYSTARYAGPLGHNLLRIIDPAGNMYLENQYGVGPSSKGFNKVIRQRFGSGEIQLEYEDFVDESSGDYTDIERPTIQVNLVERNGQAVHSIYNQFGNLLLREEMVLAKDDLVLAQWRYRYNGDGAVIDVLTPEGRLMQAYYGRDDFLRINGITDADVATSDALTIQARLAFANVLAVVQRAQTYSLGSLDTSHGIWGDIYPSIFATHPEDAIQKWAYEADYQQLLTSSDPRFTISADPRALEGLDYLRTLTQRAYTGPAGDPNRLLAKITYPDATQADGTKLTGVSETIDAYDANGRILQGTDAAGVVTRFEYVDAASGVRQGFLTGIIRDPTNLSLRTAYDRDDLGRITALQSPRAQSAPAGQFVTAFSWNDLDQEISVTSSAPFSYVMRLFYDPNGMVERSERDAKDEKGVDLPGAPEVRTIAYDEELNLLRETLGGTDLSQHFVTRHAYDVAGQRIVTVLPAGNRVFFKYDERGLRRAVTRGPGTPDASTTATHYDLDGLLVESVNARGFIAKITRDAFGRITERRDPLGNVWRFAYDKAGNLTVTRVFQKQADGSYALLARGEAQYDERNRPIRFSANAFDTPVPVTNLDTDGLASPGPGRFLTVQYFYERGGRLARCIDPLGRRVAFEYGVQWQPLAFIDAAGNRTENHYDANENLIRRDVREIVRDPATNAPTSQIVFSQTFNYDTLDRLESTTDPLGNITSYAYDSRGNVGRQIDPLGNVRRTECDIYGRVVRHTRWLTDSGLGTGNILQAALTQFSYDANDNLVAVTDPLQRLTRYEFDALDRLASVIYPDQTKITRACDADSNLRVTADANGVKRTYTRDGIGQVVRVDVDASAAIEPIEGSGFERYEYDALGAMRLAENAFARCEMTFNSVGWPVADTTTLTTTNAPFMRTLVVLRTFDDAGALGGITYPDGRQLKYSRNELGRLTRVDNVAIGSAYPGAASPPSIVAAFEYAGRARSRAVLGNGTQVVYAYDGADRLIELQHAVGTAPFLTVQQLFDDAWNVRFRNDVAPAGGNGNAFAYDSFYRLTYAVPRTDLPVFDPGTFAPPATVPPDPIPNEQAAIDATIGTLAEPNTSPNWAYDLVGNRTKEQQSGGRSVDYTSNTLDQYETVAGIARRYDANGNLRSDGAQTYIYDSLNRLTRVINPSGGELARYQHDALGRRVLCLAGGSATHIAYNGQHAVTDYLNGNPLAQIVYDDMLDAAVHLATGNQDYWYHLDPNRSVRGLTDLTGQATSSYTYTPFGVLQQASGPYNPLRFTGRRFDETIGSYDFRSRQYDPATGRFLQRDPSGIRDGTNLYVYAGNDPLAYVDPFGMSREPVSTSTSASPALPPIPTAPPGGLQTPAPTPPNIRDDLQLESLQRNAANIAAGTPSFVLDWIWSWSGLTPTARGNLLHALVSNTPPFNPGYDIGPTFGLLGKTITELKVTSAKDLRKVVQKAVTQILTKPGPTVANLQKEVLIVLPPGTGAARVASVMGAQSNVLAPSPTVPAKVQIGVPGVTRLALGTLGLLGTIASAYNLGEDIERGEWGNAVGSGTAFLAGATGIAVWTARYIPAGTPSLALFSGVFGRLSIYYTAASAAAFVFDASHEAYVKSLGEYYPPSGGVPAEPADLGVSE